jgi:hypothetical protein
MEDQALQKLDTIDQKIDRIVTKVIEHDDRLGRIEEAMATKEDIRQIKLKLQIV